MRGLSRRAPPAPRAQLTRRAVITLKQKFALNDANVFPEYYVVGLLLYYSYINYTERR